LRVIRLMLVTRSIGAGGRGLAGAALAAGKGISTL
jgi:hypothetical protein